MNKSELEEHLRKELVDPAAYSLEGGQNWYEKYCLDREGSRWVVYFAERGERLGLRAFDTESEACEYLLAWVLDDPTTRNTKI